MIVADALRGTPFVVQIWILGAQPGPDTGRAAAPCHPN
jgi:hypothetical protein